MAELAPPDWTLPGYARHLGGELDGIPRPHVRYYRDHPNKRKRPVKVQIHKYAGVGKHYFVDIEEADDPIWNAAEGYWQRPWHDRAGEGEARHGKFNTYEAVERFVRLTLADTFPRSTHTYIQDGVRQRWLYREGD